MWPKIWQKYVFGKLILVANAVYWSQRLISYKSGKTRKVPFSPKVSKLRRMQMCLQCPAPTRAGLLCLAARGRGGGQRSTSGDVPTLLPSRSKPSTRFSSPREKWRQKLLKWTKSVKWIIVLHQEYTFYLKPVSSNLFFERQIPWNQSCTMSIIIAQMNICVKNFSPKKLPQLNGLLTASEACM